MRARTSRRFGIREGANLLVDAYKEWQSDHPAVLAAGLSYFTVISLAPVTILLTALMGRIWTQQNIQHMIIDKLVIVTGRETARSVGDFLALTAKKGKGGATVFSVLVLYFTSSRLFAQMHTALDIIWDVPQHQESFVRHYLRSTVKNLLMAVGLVLFLSLFIIIDAAMAFGLKFTATFMPEVRHLHGVEITHVLAPFVLFAPLFAALYKLVPDLYIPWSDVWPGAIFTAFLFAAGKAAITEYLRFHSIKTIYGAASSVVILMAWVYLAAHFFFFGAAFTRVYAHKHGSFRRAKKFQKFR